MTKQNFDSELLRKILIFATLAFPMRTAFVDFRGTIEGAEIEMESFSPAFAAFDDAYDITSTVRTPNTAAKTLRVRPESKVTADRVIALSRLDPSVMQFATAPVLAAADEPDIFDHAGELKPLETRKRELLNYYQNQDWKTPSLKEKVQELAAKSWSVTNPKKVFVQNAQATLTPGNEPADKNSGVREESTQGFKLTGRLRMEDGLAVTGGNAKVIIYRQRDGMELEKGEALLQDGVFSIEVSALEGFLVGEVVNSRGIVFGEGDLNLSSIADKTQSGLELVLKPAGHGFATRVISAYSFMNQEIKVADSKLEFVDYPGDLKTNEDGEFTDDQMTYDSHALMRARAKGHWPTLSLVTAMRDQPIRLYAESYLQSFVKATMNEDLDKNRMAIVFGQVRKNGQPLAGAKIELARLGAKAIYFNSFFPDVHLDATSENGDFALIFYDVGETVETFRVQKDNQLSLAQTMTLVPGHVSEIGFDFAETRRVGLFTYDAFSGDAVDGGVRVAVQGYDGEMDLGRMKHTLDIDGGDGLAEFYFDAGREAVPERYLGSRRARDLQIPIVAQSWLTGLSASHRISLGPNESAFVGFVVEDDYDVQIPEIYKQRMSVVYFDKQGRSIPRGIAGGGFVVFGVPYGQHNFIINGHQTGLTRVTSVYSDAQATPVDVIHFD